MLINFLLFFYKIVTLKQTYVKLYIYFILGIFCIFTVRQVWRYDVIKLCGQRMLTTVITFQYLH